MSNALKKIAARLTGRPVHVYLLDDRVQPGQRWHLQLGDQIYLVLHPDSEMEFLASARRQEQPVRLAHPPERRHLRNVLDQSAAAGRLPSQAPTPPPEALAALAEYCAATGEDPASYRAYPAPG